MDEKGNVYRVLVGNLKERDHLGKYRWDYNIKMDIKEIGRDGLNCIHLAQGSDMLHTVVNTVMNELSVHIKYGECLD
jgi:hypothetical protein